VARACGLDSGAATRTVDVSVAASVGRRALVVDDDQVLRRTLVRLLRKAEFEVADVGSGSRAIAALEVQAFDVVVSDVQMPDGTGLDLLRAIAASTSTSPSSS